jgi:hypothetical protein
MFASFRTWRRLRAQARAALASPSAAWLRPLLHLIAFYPLLLVVPVLLLLLVYGALLAEYDAFHQLWSEYPAVGVPAGFAAGLVLGGVVLAVSLLDAERRARAAAPLPPVPAWGYWAAWGVLLAAAALPAILPGYGPRFATAGERLWFPLGLLAAAAVFGLARRLRPGWFALPGVLAAWAVVVLLVVFVVLTVAHGVSSDLYVPAFPAPVSLLLLAVLLTGLLAIVTWQAGRAWWLYPGLIGLLVVPFLIPSCQPEYRLPHLDYDARAELARYPDLRRSTDAGLLNDEEALANWDGLMRRRYGGPQPVVLVMVSGGATASAVYSADVLFTLEEQFPGFADRIRLISGASGGMLGAAYFVTQLRPGGLLDRVRHSDQYRAYFDAVYAANPDDPAARQRLADAEKAYRDYVHGVRDEFFRGLEEDVLGPLVQKWVFQDLPLAALPRGTTDDRGSAVEAAWRRNFNGALDVPVRALREEERAGAIPSLVFTPMMIEDGRQLIISNLDLDYMVDTVLPPPYQPAAAAVGPAAAVQTPTAAAGTSYMAVEFFRLFPHADQFRLSTAVRMNASFPFFSPSAALPTNPARHVVDAGYYDNYGTATATKWVARHVEWLAAHGVPEVILLQVRCFGYEQSSREFVTRPEVTEYDRRSGRPAATADDWARDSNPPAVSTQGGLYSLTSPLFGLFSAWRANMVYRGDERVDANRRLLDLAALKRASEGGPPVALSRYPIECRMDPPPPLNWALTRHTLELIHADVSDSLNAAAIVTNFHRSRSVAPPGAAAVAQARPPAPTTKPGSTREMMQATPTYKNAPPADRQTIESQADLTERLGKYKLAKPPEKK